MDYTITTTSRLLVSIVDLGGEIVLDVADLLDGVLDDDGNVGGHGDDDGGAEVGGLGEEVQVAEGEGELDGLLHVDDNGL